MPCFFVLIDVVPCASCAEILIHLIKFCLDMASSIDVVIRANIFGSCVSLWQLLLLLIYCKCFVNLLSYIIYRLFFVGCAGTLVVMTFKHIWVALKLDIKVSITTA